MGIKSFQGVRKVVKKEFDAPILVEDYMTKKLITFSPDQSILTVMEHLAKYHISTLFAMPYSLALQAER